MLKRVLALSCSLILVLLLALPAYAVTDYVAVNDRQIISLAYYAGSKIWYGSSSLTFTGMCWSVPYASSSVTTYGGQASFYLQNNVNMTFYVYLPYGGIVELMLPSYLTIEAVSYDAGEGLLYTEIPWKTYYGESSGVYTIKSGSSSYDVTTYSITFDHTCCCFTLNLSSLSTGTRVIPYAYGGINAFNPPVDVSVDTSDLENILENIRILLENNIAVDLAALKKYTYSIYSKIDNVESYVASCKSAFQKCIDRADYSSALNYATVVDTIYGVYIDLCDEASDFFQICIIKDLFDVYLNKAQNDYSKMLADKYKLSEYDSDTMDKYSEAEKAVFDSFSMAQFESLTSYDQFLLKLDTEQASYLKQIYDLIINSEFGQAFVFVPLSFSLMALLLGAPIRSSVKVENTFEAPSINIPEYDYYDKTLYLSSGKD